MRQLLINYTYLHTYFCLTFRIILPDVEIELSPAPSLTSLATPPKQVDVPMETTKEKDTNIEDKSNKQKRPRESTPPVLEEDEKETRVKLKVSC